MVDGFTTDVHVRWSDIDTYRHANHPTLGLLIQQVRALGVEPDSKPAVTAETRLATAHIEEQRLVRRSPWHRGYLQRWLR